MRIQGKGKGATHSRAPPFGTADSKSKLPSPPESRIPLLHSALGRNSNSRIHLITRFQLQRPLEEPSRRRHADDGEDRQKEQVEADRTEARVIQREALQRMHGV